MIAILRYVDNLLGKILSEIFRIISFFKFKKNNSNIKETEIKKVLFIKLWGLGNLTIIWPLIYKVKENYPEAFCFFLTFDRNKGFLEKNQAIDKIIYFKFTTNVFKIISQFITLLKTLRKEKLDTVVNFETFNNASALFCYLTKAPLRIGVNGKYEKIFYTHWVSNASSSHISQIFLDLLRNLGIDSPYRYYYFKESEDEKNKIKSILRAFGIEKFICIHPGTSENFKGKRWRIDNYSKLSDMLIERYGLPIIFTGTEKDLVKNLIERILIKDKVFNFAGYLNIWEFIELIRRCFLFISNDTGVVHLAASLGVNTVVFYGPSAPQRYKPLNGHSLIFYKNVECSPCIGRNYMNKKCRNKFKCMDFSPEEVFYEISSFFEKEI